MLAWRALCFYLFCFTCVSNSSSVIAILIPFPPPPRTALIMTGYPIALASDLRRSTDWSSPWYPLLKIFAKFKLFPIFTFEHFFSERKCVWNVHYPITGTPALAIMIFDVDLIPISLIAWEGGPTNMTLDWWQSSANSTFSDKNP